MSTIQQIEAEVAALANPESAAMRAKFFQTGPGQYAEGDRFLGLTVPQQRKIAKMHGEAGLDELDTLLASPVHEHRFIALVMLVQQYKRSEEAGKRRVAEFYLAHLGRVNNWDLVDASAPYILGEHCRKAGSTLLEQLAVSPDLWTRRVAMVATLAITRAGDVAPALRIAEVLLVDRHQLIHKAVGWALREVGIVDRPALLEFLQMHFGQLPRTALRYAIEHLAPAERKAALSGNFQA